MLLRLPPTRGRLLVFVRFRLPARAGGGACGRMDTASHPCHPDIYKTAFSIHLVFNILDANINSQAASIFQKVCENIWVTAAIFNLFSSNLDLVTLITSKPLIQYTQNSTYCIVVLISSLHQFFRKFGKISGS